MSELPSYFKRYLKAIQPTLASRQRAKQLHTTLRDRLAADAPYQDVYEESFLYGSYRRNTAVGQIKDVDVCVQLAPSVLELSPSVVVDRLRRVLERNGYEAKTALQRRSVRIDMSGTTLDAVPVVDGTESHGHFLIPDRKLDEWVPTYPKAHLQAVSERNKECNKRFIPLAKIVKAWFKYQTAGIERPRPKGFTLESLLYQYQDKDAPSYAEGFVNFLGTIDSQFGTMLANGTFPSVADPSRPGVQLKIKVSESEAKRFGRLVAGSLEKARAALEMDTVAESAAAWRTVFGPDFPVAPAATKQSAEMSQGDEESEELDDEITEADLPETQMLTQGRAVTASRVVPIKITARLARSSTERPYENYPSGGRSLPKGWWVVFSIPANSISGPYLVRWVVENHGEEARRAGQLSYETYNTEHAYRRQTAYRGSHALICELHQNGVAVARGRHVVNVR